MEIFHSHDRPNYEEVKSYGPGWLAEFKEMDANYQYAGWTLDLMAIFLTRIVNNQFPEYADEDTIRMLERLIQIEYDEPNVSLEERRRTVLAYYYGIGKLNRTSIINMAEKYTGCECTVYWKGSVLYVAVVSNLDESILWDYNYAKLANILRRRMPAHLGIGFESRFEPILLENKMEVLLKNVKSSYKILFWDYRCLDGSWLLDGSYVLDAHRRYGLALGMQSIYKLRSNEEMSLYCLNTRWTQHLQERILQGTVYRFGISDQEKSQVKMAMRHSLEADVSELEAIKNVNVVTKSKDCWFLNGAVGLGGSRVLDSIYREEAV